MQRGKDLVHKTGFRPWCIELHGRLLYTPTLNLLCRAAKLAALECQSVEWTNLPEESVPVAVFPVGAQRSFHQYNLSQFEMLRSPTNI